MVDVSRHTRQDYVIVGCEGRVISHSTRYDLPRVCLIAIKEDCSALMEVCTLLSALLVKYVVILVVLLLIIHGKFTAVCTFSCFFYLVCLFHLNSYFTPTTTFMAPFPGQPVAFYCLMHCDCQQLPTFSIFPTTVVLLLLLLYACPLSCASAEAYKLAQCTRPQGWGS